MTTKEQREIETRGNFTGRLQQAAVNIGSVAGVVRREIELGLVEENSALEVYEELRTASQAILRALQKCQHIRACERRERTLQVPHVVPRSAEHVF